MEPGITFISVYRCPRCETALEAVQEASLSWLRCPECGRPCQPPPFTFTGRFHYRRNRRRTTPGRDGDVLWIPAEESDRRRPIPWLKCAGFAAVVAVPVLVCVALGREVSEACLLGLVVGVGLILLLRPWKSR